MICIRQDLIDKELKSDYFKEKDIEFNKFKLTKRFISWLFRHYKTEEYSIHFYDSEPDIPEEWDERRDEYFEDIWENQEFMKIWNWLVEEHEPKRIQFNNWIDSFGEGIWDMNQHEVDKYARENLIEVRKTPVKKDGRLWIGRKDDIIWIYWYGRDFEKCDLWWIMKRR